MQTTLNERWKEEAVTRAFLRLALAVSGMVAIIVVLIVAVGASVLLQ